MPDTLPLGAVLNNRYKIISVLGQGGMSNVYLVEDDKLQSRWALKEMLDVFPDSDKAEILERFRKEAQILAGIKHANLPRVFDYFEEQGRHYLVMEHIEGLTLQEIFDQNPGLSWQKAVDWGVQICDVLESLHGAGIVYRDLKPANVMVDRGNRVYLIDFGIARLFTGNKIHDTVIIGTPGFASPEHHGTAETDSRSDIFSLGATLHYLITRKDPGIIPFVFEEPSSVSPQVPHAVSAAVMKALSLKPGDRFQKAAHMREALLKASGAGAALSPHKAHPPAASATKTLPPAGGTDAASSETFRADLVKVYETPAALSGGMLAFASWLLTMGGGFVPDLVILSLCAWAPSAYVFRRIRDHLLGMPREITISAGQEGIQFIREGRAVLVPWGEITGLLSFREQSRVGIPVTKYRVSTLRGDFEYSTDMEKVNRINDLIITRGNLRLVSESGAYRRYARQANDEY
jgi:serine/threonine-protein kinase